MSGVEIAATLLGLACVVLTMRQNVWCWPVGIAQVALYAYVFCGAKLYADVGLQVVFVFVQAYGWWKWVRGSELDAVLPVARLATAQAVRWVAIGGVLSGCLGWTLATYTDASLPYMDSVIAVFSLIAQYLIARKVLESWLVWIMVDVLAIGVYAAKSLYLTAGLYAVFLVLATGGWFAWRRSLQIQRHPLVLAAAA